MNRIGKQTIIFNNKPKIISNSAIVGPKEFAGPLKQYYDYRIIDDKWNEDSFEKAERKMLEFAICTAIRKSGKKLKNIDLLVSGDLLNQIITSSYAARKIDTMYLGVYNACSTFTEALTIGSVLVDGRYLNNVACATGSHFSTAERQYRFPLELGNQRTPASQRTVTGAGCSILSLEGKGPSITMATMGKVIDYGIKDVNNMGAAMAPAAMNTLLAHFDDTGTKPEDYDLILTGDLGNLGSELLKILMKHKGIDISEKHNDCGKLIFSDQQRTIQGGSGSGCSASVFNSYIIKKFRSGEYNKILFMATGALLSTISTQQGDSIPAIAHAVVIER